ncbi:MAG TPA: hypothetical protein VI757_10970 [Bacteroidia bacterium]|nr:hypothetical protein [Bacteroidia bacterium]
MKKFFLLLILLSGISASGFSQSAAPDFAEIDTLKKTGQIVLHAKTDSARTQANSIFTVMLMETLALPGAFEVSFDSVINVSVLMPPDKSFRLFTWTQPRIDLSAYTYFGFIQKYDKVKKELKVFPLEEMVGDSENVSTKKLPADKWYGAIYYEILPVKKSGKNYYTLLGWKGNDQRTTKKLIDVLYFNEGKPMFGYPIFKGAKGYTNRVVFEFAAEAMMGLRYEESKKLIVFDRIVSTSETTASSSGPSGVYDAFKFEKGRWLLLKDIDVRGNWQPKTPPEKEDESGKK